MDQVDIQYVDVDESLQKQISRQWGEWAARYVHLEDGFSIVAMHRQEPVGLISVHWQDLPSPLINTGEGYIAIIEVIEAFRRRGIAKKLIDLSFERARQQGVYQLRAWSSEDRTEAIPMWKALGFGLCPATIYPGGQEVKGYFVTQVL